jgi:hypothetical protein
MQISRLELYELVSGSPLSRVAPGLGISATTLAAICREHGVPYPGSGYWTRKSLGQEVVLELLPAASGSQEQPISIEPSKPRTPRIQVRTTDVTAEALKSTEHIISANAPMINERPIEPHLIIAGWLANHERRRREATTSRDPWRIKMAPARCRTSIAAVTRFSMGCFALLKAKARRYRKPRKACFVSP